MATIFDATPPDAYSVPRPLPAWFDASVKAPYRNAVTAIITGATDIDGRHAVRRRLAGEHWIKKPGAFCPDILYHNMQRKP